MSRRVLHLLVGVDAEAAPIQIALASILRFVARILHDCLDLRSLDRHGLERTTTNCSSRVPLAHLLKREVDVLEAIGSVDGREREEALVGLLHHGEELVDDLRHFLADRRADGVRVHLGHDLALLDRDRKLAVVVVPD